MSRWCAVLAGGSGTRFWPLSTPSRPKQTLPLTGEVPLLSQAIERIAGLIPPERVLIVTGRALVDTTKRLAPTVPVENILVEPQPRSTGPALTWASSVAAARDPHATVLSLHADWHVADPGLFRETAARAMQVAEQHDVLVTVGIVPTRPDVGYGYIEPGDPLDGDARAVRRFVEKPTARRAAQLIDAGALWNSGLFAWTTGRFFAETRSVAPEIAEHLDHLERAEVDAFFATVEPIAVDVSHFERSTRVACIPGRFPWDDVGTWGALERVRPVDAAGNVLVGETFANESEHCVVWAADGAVVVDGVDNLVVIRANEVTLVTTRERAARLKALLDVLPPPIRDRPR